MQIRKMSDLMQEAFQNELINDVHMNQNVIIHFI